jgi:hypothetical protein
MLDDNLQHMNFNIYYPDPPPADVIEFYRQHGAADARQVLDVTMRAVHRSIKHARIKVVFSEGVQGAADTRYLRVMTSRRAICRGLSTAYRQRSWGKRRDDQFEGVLEHSSFQALETMTLLEMEKVHSPRVRTMSL